MGETVQKRGAAVMNQRKASSGMSAADAIKDHLRTWIFGTQQDEIVSMAVYTDGNSYGIEKDLICSLPVKCQNFEWSVQQGLEIDQFSQEQINKSVQELIEERTECS